MANKIKYESSSEDTKLIYESQNVRSHTTSPTIISPIPQKKIIKKKVFFEYESSLTCYSWYNEKYFQELRKSTENPILRDEIFQQMNKKINIENTDIGMENKG